MQTLLLVAVGGGAGAVLRHLLGVQALRALGSGWPYGTLAANVLGGLLTGMLAGWLALRGGPDPERWRLLLGVGVLGGFTTFSAFSLDAVTLIERGEIANAAAYALLSVAGAVLGLYVGLVLTRVAS